MGLNTYKSKGWEVGTPENRAAMVGMTVLTDACRGEKILEGRALVCDNFHNLLVDLDYMKGLISREEGAPGIREGTTRDTAIVLRANRPVCFIITGFRKDDADNPTATLSCRVAQEKCRRKYIEKLRPGDVTDARVTHLETFDAFADIDCGVISLLSIDAISASYIDHPREWFTVGMDVRTITRSIERDRITLAQKGLLGTWEENVALFHTGETVVEIICSAESYGIFVESAPNPAGLAEIKEGVLSGQWASVYIKNILSSRMRIEFAIIDILDYSHRSIPSKYLLKGDHMNRLVCSPEYSDEQIIAEFLQQQKWPAKQ